MADVVSSGSSINGISQFSQNFINLQDSYCCWNADGRHIIRWIGCNPSIYKNGKNVFSPSDLAFCSWFQVVDNYQFTILEIESEGLVEVNLDSKYLMMKTIWPTGTTGPLESQKVLEVTIPDQAGYIGMTIPFNIGNPSTRTTHVFKDVFHMNSESLLDGTLTILNPSAFTVDVAIMYAK